MQSLIPQASKNVGPLGYLMGGTVSKPEVYWNEGLVTHRSAGKSHE